MRVTSGVRAAVPAAYIHGSLLLLLGSLVYSSLVLLLLIVVVYPGSLGTW